MLNKKAVHSKESPIKSIVLSVSISLIISAILFCICAFVISLTNKMPLSLIEPIVLLLSSISCFIGGYICAKIEKQKGLILGAIIGLIVFVITFLVGYLVVSNDITYFALLKAVGNILLGAIGGVLGVNKKR